MKLLAALLSCVCGLTWGACPAPQLTESAGFSATLQWGAVTLDTTGKALPGAVTYNLYDMSGASPALKTSGLTTNSTSAPNLAAGTYCWAATAVSAAVESDKSNTFALAVVVTPAPPSNLTVTTTTAYTLIKETDRLVMLPVGTVPLTTACIADQSANGYNAVPRAAVTFAGDVQPPVVFASCH